MSWLLNLSFDEKSCIYRTDTGESQDRKQEIGDAQAWIWTEISTSNGEVGSLISPSFQFFIHTKDRQRWVSEGATDTYQAL